MRTHSNTPSNVEDRELKIEYRFDYAKSKPNRFAPSLYSQPVFVQLAPDVAEMFQDSESVNAALRSFLNPPPKWHEASGL
jgi:hypothetical protein